MMKLTRKTIKKIKLIILYLTRIIFVRNKFKVSFFTKVKANLFGGYLADQYILYDFKHNDKKDYATMSPEISPAGGTGSSPVSKASRMSPFCSFKPTACSSATQLTSKSPLAETSSSLL